MANERNFRITSERFQVVHEKAPLLFFLPETKKKSKQARIASLRQNVIQISTSSVGRSLERDF